MSPYELTNTIEQFIVYVHRNEAHFTYIYVYHTIFDVKVDWMLESFYFPRGPSMCGINYQQIVYMLVYVNTGMFKIKIDKYLVKAGYT